MFDQFITAAQQYLIEHPNASLGREYLHSRLPMEAWNSFSLGFFPGEEDIKTFFSYVPESELINMRLRYDMFSNAGMYRKTKTNFFKAPAIVMPYRDVYGETIAIVGRYCWPESKLQERNLDRYKNTSFPKTHHIFGLYEAKRSILQENCVYLVEGQFDCIQAHHRGIKNVVAMGCSTVSGYQISLLLRYTRNINILFDNDDGGRVGAERTVKKYFKYANLKEKRLPTGYKDLDELIKENSSFNAFDLEKL